MFFAMVGLAVMPAMADMATAAAVRRNVAIVLCAMKFRFLGMFL